jgi:biopolymer transport protein ExbB/TolQ
MFMWGMIDVLLKLAGFPKESWALRRDWIPPRTGRVPISQAAEMLERIQSQPRRSLNTRIGQRLLHALTFVVENQSAEELPDHLRYLADEDEDTTFHRYSLIRFVVAVTPILGFLGTVVHFGTALSGLSLANIEKPDWNTSCRKWEPHSTRRRLRSPLP